MFIMQVFRSIWQMCRKVLEELWRLLMTAFACTIKLFVWKIKLCLNFDTLLQDTKLISAWEFNSLWPNDTIWWHTYGSTLAQVMACCLTAPSHYLNQCWLHISDILWHSPESNFTISAPASMLYSEYENHTFKVTATSCKDQWVKQKRNTYSYHWWLALI